MADLLIGEAPIDIVIKGRPSDPVFQLDAVSDLGRERMGMAYGLGIISITIQEKGFGDAVRKLRALGAQVAIEILLRPQPQQEA